MAILSTPTMTPEGVANKYDELDPFYRDIWGEHVHHGVWRTGKESDKEAAESLVAMAAEAGQMTADTRVCDVGCGYGATARILAERSGAQVTGVTLSPVQHRFAEKHNAIPGKTSFVLGNWYENTFPDQSFDVVLSVESMEHMPDLPAYFAEAWRLLKPGGRVVVCAWMSCENPTPGQKRLLIDACCREGQLAGIRPLSEFQKAVEGAGFTQFHNEDLSQQVKRTWPLCAIRTLKGFFTNPAYIKFVFKPNNRNRTYIFMLYRMWLGYNIGVMRYGVFSAVKAG